MLNDRQLELPGIIDYSKDNWELNIEYSETSSPREWDNIGVICVPDDCEYCKCEDKAIHLLSILDWFDNEADKKTLEKEGYLAFPLSVYDHSGVSFYIGGRCDAWDSSCIGWYIVSKKDILERYNVKRISKKILEKVEKRVEQEIRTYDAYYNDRVYGFTLSHNGEEVDSCGGFIDDYDDYKGFIVDMYEYFPKEFTNAFTVEQAKQMAVTPW